MKNLLLAGFIGIAITVALDTAFRVFISLFAGYDFTIVYYEPYPGVLWQISIVVFSAVSAYAGALFSISSHRDQKKTAFILFTVLLLIVKYIQVHLLIGIETLIYPIASLVFALIGILFVWKRNISGKTEEEKPAKKHHQPGTEPW